MKHPSLNNTGWGSEEQCNSSKTNYRFGHRNPCFLLDYWNAIASLSCRCDKQELTKTHQSPDGLIPGLKDTGSTCTDTQSKKYMLLWGEINWPSYTISSRHRTFWIYIYHLFHTKHCTIIIWVHRCIYIMTYI